MFENRPPSFLTAIRIWGSLLKFLNMKQNHSKPEDLNIEFWGFKFKSSNPGKKTIIILSILLIFFLVLVGLLKVYALPVIVAAGSKNVLRITVSRIGLLLKIRNGKSP